MCRIVQMQFERWSMIVILNIHNQLPHALGYAFVWHFASKNFRPKGTRAARVLSSTWTMFSKVLPELSLCDNSYFSIFSNKPIINGPFSNKPAFFGHHFGAISSPVCGRCPWPDLPPCAPFPAGFHYGRLQHGSRQDWQCGGAGEQQRAQPQGGQGDELTAEQPSHGAPEVDLFRSGWMAGPRFYSWFLRDHMVKRCGMSRNVLIPQSKRISGFVQDDRLTVTDDVKQLAIGREMPSCHHMSSHISPVTGHVVGCFRLVSGFNPIQACEIFNYQCDLNWRKGPRLCAQVMVTCLAPTGRAFAKVWAAKAGRHGLRTQNYPIVGSASKRKDRL